LIATHYKQQFNFTFKELESAKSAVEKLDNFVLRLKEAKQERTLQKMKLQKQNLNSKSNG